MRTPICSASLLLVYSSLGHTVPQDAPPSKAAHSVDSVNQSLSQESGPLPFPKDTAFTSVPYEGTKLDVLSAYTVLATTLHNLSLSAPNVSYSDDYQYEDPTDPSTVLYGWCSKISRESPLRDFRSEVAYSIWAIEDVLADLRQYNDTMEGRRFELQTSLPPPGRSCPFYLQPRGFTPPSVTDPSKPNASSTTGTVSEEAAVKPVRISRHDAEDTENPTVTPAFVHPSLYPHPLNRNSLYLAALKVFKRVAVMDKDAFVPSNRAFFSDSQRPYEPPLPPFSDVEIAIAPWPQGEKEGRLTWKELSWTVREMLLFIKRERRLQGLKADVSRNGDVIAKAGILAFQAGLN